MLSDAWDGCVSFSESLGLTYLCLSLEIVTTTAATVSRRHERDLSNPIHPHTRTLRSCSLGKRLASGDLERRLGRRANERTRANKIVGDAVGFSVYW